MGFSCGVHFEEKEMEFSLIDESIATTQSSIIMEVYHHPHLRVDNTDFFPVEHPLEPPDEDRPVKCPMPESSVISDERMHEKRKTESIRKREEISGAGRRTAATDTGAPARGVRKRHHTLTHGSGGDIVMTPLMRMPSLPPLQSQNITIFQVLQQLDKFES
ncbi:unnamed protein product [Lathyrus oleraceus]|uniref:Uncharacterized protein n=2 Tax=Pisum sativum TaxID=3888 RepID=A0A9D4ZUP1_PEA|nr:uncharacterized protein LOC127101042 isoform X1 [Pisum sativum]KAI5385401.1 hypothetical protein KIW84_072120 [Pisum sativum]